MSDLSLLDGKQRLMLQQEQLALRGFQGTFDSFPTSAATYQFWLGIVNAPGHRFYSVNLITPVAVAVHASNYVSFQPIMAVDGAITRIGTPVLTNALAIAANTPFRLHTEKNLRRTVPYKAAVGFEAILTGSFVGLTRPLFQADLYANA